MASALISGLANPPRSDLRIRVVDPDDGARSRLRATFDVPVFTDKEAIGAIQGADVILLAIKPQTMPVVLNHAQHACAHRARDHRYDGWPGLQRPAAGAGRGNFAGRRRGRLAG